MPNNIKSKPIYSNHVLQAPDGTPISRIGSKRSKWYLQHGLARVVRPFPFQLQWRFPFIVRNKTPFTIRLNFEPKGRGNAGDEYYLADKENKCVVCAREEGINQHHVVPRLFRRLMPEQYKDRNSYDVVVLCVGCHSRYESLANERKKQIAEDLGYKFSAAKLADQPEEFQREYNACKAAVAILNNRDEIPQSRLEFLEARVRKHLGDVNLTDEVLEELASRPLQVSHHPLGATMAKYVLDRVDIDKFCLEWREHFVEIMKPKYLPVGWTLQRPANRLN